MIYQESQRGDGRVIHPRPVPQAPAGGGGGGGCKEDDASLDKWESKNHDP